MELTTVIIVNWNTKDLLRNCLMELTNDNWNRFSVKVVDNASHDGSAEMVKQEFPQIQLIESGGNFGFGRANNMALKTCTTKYSLFLNPDTIAPCSELTKMVNFMEGDEKVGAVGCKMINKDGSLQPLGLQWFPNPFVDFFSMLFLTKKSIPALKSIIPYHDPNKSGFLTKLYGGCLLVRKSVLDKIGFFDERFFMYCEDVDLCRRITDNQWKLYYMAEASIIHLGGEASKQSKNMFPLMVKYESTYSLMKKYYGLMGGLTYKGLMFLGSFLRLTAATGIQIINRRTNSALHKKYSTILLWSLYIKVPKIKTAAS